MCGKVQYLETHLEDTAMDGKSVDILRCPVFVAYLIHPEKLLVSDTYKL